MIILKGTAIDSEWGSSSVCLQTVPGERPLFYGKSWLVFGYLSMMQTLRKVVRAAIKPDERFY